MKRLLAMMAILSILLTLPALAVGEEAGVEIPDWLPGRWWLVKVRADCGRNGSVIHGLDISASLHLHKARGTHLTFGADGSLDTDVDVATLLEEAPTVPFDLPSVSILGDHYACSDGTISFLPDGDTYDLSLEDDDLVLRYKGTTILRPNEKHPNYVEGEADITVTLSFVRYDEDPSEPTPTPTPEPTPEPTLEPTPEPTPEATPIHQVINRDIVTFGHWEQDNDFDDGLEPLEWLVLERDAETVKLISLNVLRQEPFHDEYGRVTWETCSLRPWLNGEFMEQAFTPWEREQLVLTTVTADANPEYGTDAGNDTQDRVWLMSAKEALTYFDSDAERIACPTEWGVNHGCRPSGDAGACFWVLRTPGRNQENISAVNWDGEVSCDSDYAVYSGFTIRPMIAVRLRDGEMPVQTEEEALAEAAMPEEEEAPEAEEVPYEIEDEDYSYVTAADGDLYVKPMLFAAGEPAAAALDRPAPADGTRYLALRLDMMDGMLEETEIRAAMSGLTLYGLSDHSTLAPVDIAVARMPGETWVRAFDLIYQDDGARPREDYALLADEALYPLAQLPGEGTTLRLAYAAELSGMGEYLLDDVLNALNDPVYRTTYDSLLAGEVIQKGSKGDMAKGVQQTLVAFGQDIAVDGNVGPKSIAALNAVQTAFGLTPTESLDAVGYAELLPRLLLVTNPDEADALLMGGKDYGEYDYMCACALAVQGKYASAKAMFEQSQWSDWEARAAACVQPWPKNGVLYKNPDVRGSSTELTVKFNTEPDTAMLVKIYTADGVLARTMFIGGTGKATASLPAGTYIIKDGTGKNWYGEAEAFGSEGSYEIMTFEGGVQEVQLKKNYASTITVNVQDYNPDAQGIGSDWESWGDF